MKISEYTQLEGQAEGNVFRNVKVLGRTSRNGYTYSEQAVAKAVALYEGVPVYVDHNSKSRSYAERLGTITSPRLQDGDVYGTFQMNPKHRLAEQISWDAANGTVGVGFSHSVDGKMSKDKKIVESVDKVYSVDWVASPATCDSMFESIQEEENDIDELRRQVTDLAAAIAEIKTTLASLAPKAEAQAEAIKSQAANIQELQTRLKTKPVAFAPSATPTQDTYKDFLKRVIA